MASNEELPIFLDAYELLSNLLVLVPKLPKIYRFNIGSRMIDDCLGMIAMIFEANTQYGANKVAYINKLMNRHSMLRMLMRQMMEKGIIGSRQMAQYMILMDKIGKQANGWKKHYSE